MKAKKVLQTLEITRKTLNNYIKSNKIRVTPIGNGFYDYNDFDVEELKKQQVFKDKLVIYLDNTKHEFALSKDKLKILLKITQCFA